MIMGSIGNHEDCRRFTGDRVRHADINQYDQNATQITKMIDTKKFRNDTKDNTPVWYPLYDKLCFHRLSIKDGMNPGVPLSRCFKSGFIF